MRAIWRPLVAPPTVSKPGGKGYEYSLKQRLRTAPRDQFKGHEHWRSPDVRGALWAACGEGCAYCCDLIGRIGEDVEHFRPKSVYWFLAYSFDNYLPSCRPCNSKRKGDKFPLTPGAKPASARRWLAKESRLLLDPVGDDVEHAMAIELTTKKYLWEPSRGASQQLQDRAKATIDFFGLNRDVRLRRPRANAIAEFLEDMGDGTKKARIRIRRRASRYARFGGAIRSVLAQQSPQLVPTRSEEIQWHLTELLATLDEFDETPKPDLDNREMVTYAVAALAVSPPPDVDPGMVTAAITLAGRSAEIDALAVTMR